MNISTSYQAQNQYESLSQSPIYQDLTLQRISSLTKTFIDKSKISSEMNFQQFLHLQQQIGKARQKLLKINLAITQYQQFFYAQNKEIILRQEIQQKSQNNNNIEDLLCMSIEDKNKIQRLKRKQWISQSLANFELFKNTLKIHEIQLSMILFIIQYRQNDNFSQSYQNIFGQLLPYTIRYEDTHKKINNAILQDLFELQEQFLQIYYTQVKNLIKCKQIINICNNLQFPQNFSILQYKNIINKIKIANSKIKTIIQIFPYACIKDNDDLFSFNKLHYRWQYLFKNQIIKYINISDKIALRQNFHDLKQNLNLINATMSIIDRYKLENNKSINQNISILYQRSIKIIKCAVSKKQALFQAEILFSQPKEQLAKKIWNLPENSGFRQFITLCLPSIEYSKLMYIPRMYKEYFYNKLNDKDTFLPQSDLNIYDDIFQKRSYQQTIRIRVNFSRQLIVKNERFHEKQTFFGKLHAGVGDFISSLSNSLKKQQKSPKSLIFHIHGGGFISMSSFIHQIYIRKWANELNIPIISVDYGKAPQKPFPQGLYDCFQAYMWAILKFKLIFEIQPQKIILVGDSAGGNLVASLTNLLIKWNLPLPSGIVLVYPALNLDLANYTPSFLTALNDSILPHSFLKICAKSYLANPDKQLLKNHDLISPISANNQILSKYPSTYIYVGSKDPFHDDCCRFIELLSQNKCELTILDEFPHGFLQFDLKLIPNQFSRMATNLVLQTLKQLIQ